MLSFVMSRSTTAWYAQRANGVRHNQFESRNFAFANQERLSNSAVQAAEVRRSSADEFTLGQRAQVSAHLSCQQR